MSVSILPAVPTQDLTITDDDHQFFLTLWIAAASGAGVSSPSPRRL